MVKVKHEKKGEKRKAEEPPPQEPEEKKQKALTVSETKLGLVLRWKTKMFTFLKSLAPVQKNPELVAQLNEMEGRIKLDLLMAFRSTFIAPFMGDFRRSCEAMMKQWGIKPDDVTEADKEKAALYLQWLENWFKELESDQ